MLLMEIFLIREYNEDELKRRNEVKKVDVYTQPNCPPCQIIKEFLKHNHVAFTEYDVKKDTAALNRLINNYDSYSTPTVVVDEEVVAGFQIEKLQQLLGLEE